MVSSVVIGYKDLPWIRGYPPCRRRRHENANLALYDVADRDGQDGFGAEGSMRTLRHGIMHVALVVAGLLTPAVVGGPASALAPDEVFVIGQVSVDVTAETALAARAQALVQGQVTAWKRLLARLTLPGDAEVLAAYAPDVIAPLIQGYEVLRERTSSVRYLADLSVSFNPEAVRRVLSEAGIPFAETPSRPVLIIPVMTSEGVGVLWEDPNPWREAWQNLPARDALLPVVVPYGDLADIRDLSTVQALRGDPRRLRVVADRYGARDVVVARVSRYFDVRDNLPVLEITIVRHGAGGMEETVIDSVKGQTPDDLIGLLDAGVSRVVVSLSSAWKRENLVRPGLEVRVTVVVPIDGFGRWLSIRRRLKDIGILRRWELLRLSKREALMDLWVQGDAEQLRNALRQRDLELHDGQVDYVLADRDQTIPPGYLPAPAETEAPATATTPANAAPSGADLTPVRPGGAPAAPISR
jgi:hypothetical protein